MMNILSKPISCLAVMLSLAAVLATTVTIEAADGADKKKARKKARKKAVSYTHLTLPTILLV